MKLLQDVARCNDGECPLRDGCERWLQRSVNLGLRTPHQETFRRSAADSACDARVKVRSGETPENSTRQTP